MHELALAQGIVDLVHDTARRESFRRVRKVRLVVGALACVEPTALLFGFESVARGTLADGASLELEHQPGAAQCVACGQTVEVTSRADLCPKCGSAQLLVTGGDELRVKDLEVD